MIAPLIWKLEHPELIVGWVRAKGVRVGPSDPDLERELDEAIGRRASEGPDEETKRAIRDLLRGRGYKPSGRGKPASEFLAAAAAKGRFPRINNVVDINNLASLESGWPMSIFDLEVAREGGVELELRYGHEGESFVFNPAGQSIDIGGLVVVARSDDRPIGNPVKDSMATKIESDTTDVLAVIYTSREVADRERVAAVAGRYGERLERHAGAEEVAHGVLDRESRTGAVDAGRARG